MKNIRMVLFKGLFGCSGKGALSTPNDKYSIKLPKSIAFWLHTFINKFGYVGIIDGRRYINPFRIE